MAYIKFKPGKYRGKKTIYNVIAYILDSQKNPHTITNVKRISQQDICNVSKCFRQIQKFWRKDNGRRIIHFIVCFSPDTQFSYQDYRKIAYGIIDYFYQYQVIFALHEYNKKHKPCPKHLHFALNPINYVNGKRIRLTIKKLYDIQSYINTAVLSEYGITIELLGQKLLQE